MSPRPRIVLDHVAKEFASPDRPLLAVDDVSLTVHEGEFISLVGPSGCGKTTLLNMVAGFVPPTRGRVTLDGRTVTGPGPDRGMIFQEYAVFPWLTVEDNIAFGLTLRANRVPAAERREIVSRYTRLMGLSGFERAWPRMLSGGMKQRVALARAYAVKSEFLLMDEPFGALDAQTRLAMQDLLLDVLEKEGKTVLFVTHSVEEALYLSSRIVVVTARPARIRHVVTVPFPYPRHEKLHRAPEFLELRAEVHALVMQEYADQERQRAAGRRASRKEDA
ncbi:MAG TPA: ABC transporter ATP-binding protein, partial [Candidatus Tectomicrobia bacterium]|nr:ABC transporter ATP-binding protein [Candidatus Tectomicrobia bacterium]